MTLVTHPHDIGGNTDMSTNAGIYNCHPAPVRHGLSCSGNRYVVRVAGCQRGSKRAGAQDKLVIRRTLVLSFYYYYYYYYFFLKREANIIQAPAIFLVKFLSTIQFMLMLIHMASYNSSKVHYGSFHLAACSIFTLQEGCKALVDHAKAVIVVVVVY